MPAAAPHRARRTRLFPGAGLFLLALAAATLHPAAPAVSEPAVGRPQSGLKIIPLGIRTSDGKQHAYKVELAASPEQQAHGMMFRTKMAPQTGMLFPMQPPRSASFWMRNTLIPLDLVFIGTNGKVRNIIAGAVPKSEVPLNSVGPVAAVLELASGEAERIGLRPGDSVSW